MKKLTTLVAIALMVSFISVAQSDEKHKVSYKASGIMVETCACELLCSCAYGQDARNSKGCQASIGLHFESGSYGDVKLDGLNAVAMLLKPEKNVAAAVGKLEGGLYVDAKADEKQRQAIAAIITDQYGAMFSKVVGPKAVPISFSKGKADSEGFADEYSMEIPDILTFKIASIKNMEGKRSLSMNAPMAFIPVEYHAKSVAHKYADKDWDTMWDFPAGSDAFYGKFEFVSK